MSKKTKTHLVGRDARSGELKSVEWARRHPGISTVERMPNPGYNKVVVDDKYDPTEHQGAIDGAEAALRDYFAKRPPAEGLPPKVTPA